MKYISKPTVVDAFQWDGHKRAEWPEWLYVAWQENKFTAYAVEIGKSYAAIFGDSFSIREIKAGDWIIRKENGDLWSYSPEEFEKKYEFSTLHNIEG